MTITELQSLSDEELRTALAEALGWKGPFEKQWLRECDMEGGDIWAFAGETPTGGFDEVPNYPKSLDAIEGAEKTFKDDIEKQMAYMIALEKVCLTPDCGHGSNQHDWQIYTASARQRTIAAIATLTTTPQ